MIVKEIKSQHNREVTKQGGTIYDAAGYRMDVNLWFRHKNEALFYLDSVGKVHGPMDQTYSIRLGPVQKTGKEIAFKREFYEETEREKLRSCNEFQTSKPIELHEATKHMETVLRDVSSNKTNNYQKSFLTTATHIIPKPTSVTLDNYSTTITKQNSLAGHGVTVNLTAPVETTEETSIRERRLVDELLEARNELNTLRRAKSVADTSIINDNSENYYNEKYVSKVVTDVQPTVENLRSRHYSSRQESVSNDVPPISQISSIEKSKNFVKEHSSNGHVKHESSITEMKKQYNAEKPVPKSIPVVFTNSISKTRVNPANGGSLNKRLVSETEERVNTVVPVQSVEKSFANPDDDEVDTHHEQKTVTIKRKITRRKKGSDNVNTLRDSYIERIASPLPVYDSDSGSERIKLNNNQSKPNSEVSEIIPTKSAPVNEALPNMSRPVLEELIIPEKKKPVVQSMPFEKLKSLDDATNSIIEIQQRPDWEYRDSSVPRVQIRPHQSNHHLSEETTQETYINERQAAPVSTYSARKENIKSQQMLDERNLGSRTLPMERNVGHRNEMTEEIETITLQPIGKGVQDLSIPPSATFSRPASRAATPRAFDGGAGTVRSNFFREESKHVGNYNTLPIMPKFVKANSVRNVNQSSNYDLADNYKRSTISHRASNQQAHNSSYNRVSNDQTIHAQSNRANEQLANSSSNRAVNGGQTVNTSWHTRTESYSGGNRAYPSPMSPVSHQESLTSNMHMTSAVDLQTVLNTEEQWYQPSFTRDDVINHLREKETGSFYIRNSSTFSGSFGLAIKVASLPANAVQTNDPQGDLVRHFLIETVEDASGSGVRLKGFTNELVYPSLAHLVLAHCQTSIALPTRLVLPQTTFARMDHEDGMVAKSQYQYESHQRHQQQQQHQNQQQQQQMGSSRAQLLSQSHRSMSSPGVNFMTIDHANPLHQHFMTNAIYLGKVEVDRLSGSDAIQSAVDKIMTKNSVKTSTVEIQLDSTKGITLNDKMQKLFYTRQFPVQHVLFAGFDPKHREFSTPLLQNNRMTGGRIIGIVVKKQKMILRENVVHLFCEIDDSNNISDVITFISENYLRRM